MRESQSNVLYASWVGLMLLDDLLRPILVSVGGFERAERLLELLLISFHFFRRELARQCLMCWLMLALHVSAQVAELRERWRKLVVVGAVGDSVANVLQREAIQTALPFFLHGIHGNVCPHINPVFPVQARHSQEEPVYGLRNNVLAIHQ